MGSASQGARRVRGVLGDHLAIRLSRRRWWQRWVTRRFHELYYHSGERTLVHNRWLGAEAIKCPLDLWIYQELIFDLRPAHIVETGTRHGGSALYLASMCDLVGGGQVISVDIEHEASWPQHERITYLTGSSTDPAIVADVRRRIAGDGPVLVILDSDHAAAHVLDELRAYAPLVTRDSYLIVEDTNVNGHPVLHAHGPGPWEAVDAFLAGDDRFRVDERCERFYMTLQPRGYLRREA